MDVRSGQNGQVACRSDGYGFRLFGQFEVEPEIGPLGRKARALLAYLLLSARPVERRAIAGLLWSERGETQAHASLRQCLIELRTLTKCKPPVLAVGRTRLELDRSRISVDVDLLLVLATTGSVRGVAALLPAANEQLLADLDGVDPAFDDWLRIERAQWTERFLLAATECAGGALKHGDCEGARELAARLTQFDPLNEAAARLEMQAAALCGDRDGVRRVWRRLEAVLASELSVAPSAETAALYRQLVAARPKESPEPSKQVPFAGFGLLAAQPDEVTKPFDSLPYGAAPTLPLSRSAHARRPAFTAAEQEPWPIAPRPDETPGALHQAFVDAGSAEGASLPAAKPKFDRRKLAAAGALLFVLGGGAIIASRVGDSPEFAVAFDPVKSSAGAGAGDEFSSSLSSKFAAFSSSRRAPYGVAGSASSLWQRTGPEFRVKADLARSGKNLTAYVQLIPGQGEQVLWSARFTNSADRIDELAAKAAGELNTVLACAIEPSVRQIAQVDHDRLRLALATCDAVTKGYGSARGLAIQLTERYPKSATGWAMLAESEVFLAAEIELATGGRKFPAMEVPRRYALKALGLDPAFCEGYFALAMTLEHPRDMAQRLEVVEAGLRNAPDCPELRSYYGLILFKTGYAKAGLAASLGAQQIDPVSPWISDSLVRRLLANGQTHRAFEVQAAMERITPGNQLHEEQRLRMMGEQGEPRAALAHYEKKARESGYPPQVMPLWLQVVRWRIDPANLDLEEMEGIAASDVALEPDAAYNVAAQFARVGEIERAFEFLEDAPSESFGSYSAVFWPEVAILRRDPRFFSLMRKLGLVDVWLRRKQWPDFCSEPGLAYDCVTEAARLVGSGKQAGDRTVG